MHEDVDVIASPYGTVRITPPRTITLDTSVHLWWATDQLDEVEIWRAAIDRVGARVVQFQRLREPSGVCVTVETSVRTALLELGYTPERLAAAGFQGTRAQVRRLQALLWQVILPRISPGDVSVN